MVASAFVSGKALARLFVSGKPLSGCPATPIVPTVFR